MTRTRNGSSPRLVAVCLLLGFGARMALAEGGAPAYGIQSMSAYGVNAWDMQSIDGQSAWSQSANGNRYVTSGVGVLAGGVHVPQGALITRISLEACDASDVGAVTFGLFRFDQVGGTATTLATVDTGGLAQDGCSVWQADLAAPETADNNLYRYLVQGGNDTADGLTTIGQVRVFYTLQVSAPGLPSFNDVPASDPAFQFIEALVASGITAGCGSGNFCPDAPLTRRQMAVFLAKALGLHWPEYPTFN